MSGFLLINKPTDWTSHDVVAYVRRIVQEHAKHVGLPGEVIRRMTKTGHAGTLDPFATGLLIVGVGWEATKQLEEFKQMKKEYIATLRLGYTSDTQDSTGTIEQCSNRTIEQSTNDQITEETMQSVLQKFIGKQLQTPPMFSAKKIGGKRLYKLARQGIEVERKPNEIEIYDIQLLDYSTSVIARSDVSIRTPYRLASKSASDEAIREENLDRHTSQGSARGDRAVDKITIRVTCSPGTYIRTLAHDIGQALGVGAYCEALERTAIGLYKVENAVRVQDLNTDILEKYVFQLADIK